MPDGMSPENKQSPSSIESTRSLGWKEAQDFPQPESRANVPDIRMQLGGKGGKDEENNHEREDALVNRLYYRTESLSSELISTAENPTQLFRGLRQLEKQLEDGGIPFSLSERYTPPRELSIMYERADNLRVSPDELSSLGFVRKYDPNTGLGEPTKRKYTPYVLSVDERPIFMVDERTGRDRQVDVELSYNYGTPEKRVEMARAYDKAVAELEARSILGEHISLRLNLDFRDSLEGLTATLHGGRMPKFKAEHLEVFFNMPGVNELAQNPENTRLGDQVEEAMFLNLVMLNSGSKQRMQNFLERPGAKYLIARLAKESNMDEKDWREKHIGKVDLWTRDEDRDLEKTWREEQSKGIRGELTKWANIPAWGGKPSEFGADKEKEFIQDTVGKLVGSNEASWLAATMMRVIGAYASEGYVALPNGKSLLPLGEGRYISGDDTGKFHAYMFNMKEGLKGRASGLKDMIGRIPDMAMNLFDWAGVEMDDLSLNPDGTKQKRSIWDAWLGTAGGKQKLDLLTMEPTKELTKEEPYHRLGSLNFNSLEREFHGTFTIMQWLMGNGERPTGVFVDAMAVDFRPEEFGLNELKKKIKYIGIVMNPVVLTKGSQHLYVINSESVKTIQRNFFKNLMFARIRSASFAQNILGKELDLFDLGKKAHVSVSQAKLIELFIDEALKENPGNETELIKHYIDSNYHLRTAGTLNQVDKILTRAENGFEKNVGRVIGKNKFE